MPFSQVCDPSALLLSPKVKQPILADVLRQDGSWTDRLETAGMSDETHLRVERVNFSKKPTGVLVTWRVEFDDEVGTVLG
jgi:hypothetical protein